MMMDDCEDVYEEKCRTRRGDRNKEEGKNGGYLCNVKGGSSCIFKVYITRIYNTKNQDQQHQYYPLILSYIQ